MAGTLFIVATPIGNLEDITLRAKRVLSESDLVAAEDTRRTRELLSHLGISKPMVSCYEPKEDKAVPQIIERLKTGENVALVTDGGTPAISDPGYRLVLAAHEAGIKVTPVPGASALTAALSVAGLPTDRFTFAGFLPPKTSARKKYLEQLRMRPDTLVLFESPRRAAELVADCIEVLGDREASMLREITKIHEEQLRGKLSEVLEKIEGRELKGEVTLVIVGAGEAPALSDTDVTGLIRAGLEQGRAVKDLARDIASLSGRPKKEIYELVLRQKEDEGK